MRNDGKKRLFIALNLPDEIIEIVASLIRELKVKNSRVKWTDPQGAHLTMHFLGLQDEGNEKTIREIMDSLKGTSGDFIFRLEGLATFPETARPRICYLACSQLNGQGAARLQDILKRKLKQEGFAVDERIWRPHITLGRNKGADRLAIKGLKTKYIGCEFKVNKFELMQSELKPDGAVYRPVAAFEL